MTKKAYTAHSPFSFTHSHGEVTHYKTGDEVPAEVAEHFFGAAHVTAGTPKQVDTDAAFTAAVEAEVERRVAIERERIEAAAAESRAELARQPQPGDQPRNEDAEKKAAANAETVATGETIKGSSGDPKQAEKDAAAQAAAAGKPNAGRRGS